MYKLFIIIRGHNSAVSSNSRYIKREKETEREREGEREGERGRDRGRRSEMEREGLGCISSNVD